MMLKEAEVKLSGSLPQRVPGWMKRRIPKLRFIWAILQFFSPSSALYQMGWFRSAWEEQSVDRSGMPVPWYTFSAIDFVRERVQKDFSVFEYGAGNSTIWWSANCQRVVAVEHAGYWINRLHSQLSKHCQLLTRPLGKDYVQSIAEAGGLFHIISVDGRQRAACVRFAIEYLTSDGILLLDNSNRQRYSGAIEFLHASGFKQIRFTGIAPIDNILSETSIFYRQNNVFGI